MRTIDKNIIRQMAFAIVGSSLGIIIIYILKNLLDVPKTLASIIGFAFSSAFVVFVIPKLLNRPFGVISISKYLTNLGFYIPKNWIEHLLLGILVSIVLLTGLLMGSILTCKYAFNSSTFDLGQILFSLTPGVWEEFCFRGIIMLVLLNATKSLNKAFIWQIIIFGIFHIRGVDLLAFVDAFSAIIIAISFTYLVIKTKSLFAAIVAHFLYDSFLYVVQLPGGEYVGVAENVWIYTCLWLSVGFSILLIKFFTEKLSFYGHLNFLQISGYSDEKKRLINPLNSKDLAFVNAIQKEVLIEEKQVMKEKTKVSHEKTQKHHRILALINGVGFFLMLFLGFAEYSVLVKAGFLVGIIGNLAVYFFWSKIASITLPIIYIIDAILYYTKGFKLFEHGSQHAYIFFYIIGFGYLIAGIINYIYRKKIIH